MATAEPPSIPAGGIAIAMPMRDRLLGAVAAASPSSKGKMPLQLPPPPPGMPASQVEKWRKEVAKIVNKQVMFTPCPATHAPHSISSSQPRHQSYAYLIPIGEQQKEEMRLFKQREKEEDKIKREEEKMRAKVTCPSFICRVRKCRAADAPPHNPSATLPGGQVGAENAAADGRHAALAARNSSHAGSAKAFPRADPFRMQCEARWLDADSVSRFQQWSPDGSPATSPRMQSLDPLAHYETAGHETEQDRDCGEENDQVAETVSPKASASALHNDIKENNKENARQPNQAAAPVSIRSINAADEVQSLRLFLFSCQN